MASEALYLQDVGRPTWWAEGTAAGLASITSGTKLATRLLVIGLLAVATGFAEASVSWAIFVAETIVAPVGKQSRIRLLTWRAPSAVNPGVGGILYVIAEPAF